MSYQTLQTPNTSYSIKAPQYYHKTGQRGKDRSINDIKFNPDQYSILGERTLEHLKKRERQGIQREEVEKECLEVLMTLDAEFGLQAAHYEDQVMLEKALQKITAMARDNNNLQELKQILNVLVNQRKQLKEKEDAFLNNLSVFIDFYARGDFELVQKSIIKPDFLIKERDQLKKLLAMKDKLNNDRKRFHFDLNSFLQQPQKPPTPPPEIEELPVLPPPKEIEGPTCNLWNFEHPGLREWRANFFGPQFPYHTFSIEQLMVLLGQRNTNPAIQVLPPLQNQLPSYSMSESVGSSLQLEHPYVTALGHQFPRAGNGEVEQYEYFKAMEADLLLNMRKIPPFSPEYGTTATHLNLVRTQLENLQKKKYNWIDSSKNIVNLPFETVKPTKLIHYSVPFQDAFDAIVPPQDKSLLDDKQTLITQQVRQHHNVNEIIGLGGFRFKFRALKNLLDKYGNQVTLRGALMHGEEVFSDQNNQKCSFSCQISGNRSSLDVSRLLGKAARDFEVDMKPFVGEYTTNFDLQKFKLLFNLSSQDSKLLGWLAFPLFTDFRFNQGKFTKCLFQPPSQKPPFSEPKTPLDLSMIFEIVPLPCQDSDGEENNDSMLMQSQMSGNQSSKNMRKNGDGMFDDFEEAKLLKQNTSDSERARRNQLPLKQFENLHAFKLKLGLLDGYEAKIGSKVAIRLALVKGQDVVKDIKGQNCADSRDIAGVPLKGQKFIQDLGYSIDFNVDIYDLVEKYNYEELEQFEIVVNFFGEDGIQIGWQVLPLFKFRNLCLGEYSSYLFEPPALSPPYYGRKIYSNIHLTSEITPIFPKDKKPQMQLDLSSLQQPYKPSNNPRNIQAANSQQESSNRVDMSNFASPPGPPKQQQQQKSTTIIPNPRQPPQKEEISNNNPIQNPKNSSLNIKPQPEVPQKSKVPDGPKKSNVPNLNENDEQLIIKFKTLKNADSSKCSLVNITCSVIMDNSVMNDSASKPCNFKKSLGTSTGADKNSLIINKESPFSLNLFLMQWEYEFKQLESIQIFISLLDAFDTPLGWLIVPLFKYRKLNKGTFTNYLLEPPAQSPPFNLAQIKNTKFRLEYEIRAAAAPNLKK